MIRLLILTVTGLWLSAGPALAIDCMRPLPPDLPDGISSSHDEMVAAGRTVRAFVDEAQRFLDCLKVQESLMPANEISAQRLALMAQQHNAQRHGKGGEPVQRGRARVQGP